MYLISNGDGGDVVLAGLNTNTQELYDSVQLTNKVLVTGAVTLDDTAFGKVHVCSGTSADYTITLPTALGNEGKMICFKCDPDSTILSKVVTIDGNGTQKIGIDLTRALSTGGYLTIIARITSGVGHWDILALDQGAWITWPAAIGSPGFSANPTAIVAKFYKTIKTASIRLGMTAGTSNNAAFTVTGLPSDLAPKDLVLQPTIVTDNSLRVNGRVGIAVGGTTISFFATAGAGNFTASGAKGIDDLKLTWEINA